MVDDRTAAAAGRADDEDRCVLRHLVHVGGDVVHRDVDGARHPAAGHLGRLAHVDDVRPWLCAAAKSSRPTSSFGAFSAASCAAATSWRTASMSSSRAWAITPLRACGGSAPGLVEEEHAVAEEHEGRDRGDRRHLGELLLGLGVDLAEDDVGVVLRRLLEDGRELAARPAPGSPEVDEHDALAAHGLLEVGQGQLTRAHVVKRATEAIRPTNRARATPRGGGARHRAARRCRGRVEPRVVGQPAEDLRLHLADQLGEGRGVAERRAHATWEEAVAGEEVRTGRDRGVVEEEADRPGRVAGHRDHRQVARTDRHLVARVDASVDGDAGSAPRWRRHRRAATTSAPGLGGLTAASAAVVVPVLVRGHDRQQRRAADQIEEPLGLGGRVDQHRLVGHRAVQQVAVVGHLGIHGELRDRQLAQERTSGSPPGRPCRCSSRSP